MLVPITDRTSILASNVQDKSLLNGVSACVCVPGVPGVPKNFGVPGCLSMSWGARVSFKIWRAFPIFWRAFLNFRRAFPNFQRASPNFPCAFPNFWRAFPNFRRAFLNFRRAFGVSYLFRFFEKKKKSM